MDVDLLFGTIETIEVNDEGKVRSKVVKKRFGDVVETSMKYTDTVLPKSRSELLQAFIELIDSVDVATSPFEFRVRPNSAKQCWIVDRVWTEKK